jgi:hypothetical protein
MNYRRGATSTLDRASGGAKVRGEAEGKGKAEARQAKTKRRSKGVRKTMNVASHALGVIGGPF